MPSTCDPWPSRSGVLGRLRGPHVARDVCIRGLVELCRGSRVSPRVYVVWCNFVLVRAFRFLRSLLAWTPAGFLRRIANTWRVPLTDTLVFLQRGFGRLGEERRGPGVGLPRPLYDLLQPSLRPRGALCRALFSASGSQGIT